MEKKSLWLTYSPERKAECFAFNEEYKAFMSAAKTERESVTEVIKMAKAKGYRDLYEVIAEGGRLVPGDKVYANNRGKAAMFVQIGSEDLEKGLKILGAHVDSPRLDFKQNPLYEDSEFAMVKTHYYGGIKKFQWVTLPLAIHGIICKKDGTSVNVNIGEDAGDPVFGISDILPHLGKDQNGKSIGEAFTGEDLNLNIGSIPAEGEEKNAVKKNILNILKDKYGMEEEDFLSAELEVVPAGPARDLGLDRSMVYAYGHDDRVCAYTSAAAQFALADTIPDRAYVTLLVDKEEIGSVGATGMHSRFFENCMAEIMNLTGGYSELKLRRCLSNSCMLSSDVSAGFDPNFPGVHEKMNAPFFGYGPVLSKFTGSRGKGGSNDAGPEFIASLRDIFEKDEVAFQMAELGKVDQGGGGTIAYILAQYSMDVIDVGVALHNMHAPWELASKADIFETYRAYISFLTKM
ncbi:MAG: aminopeptidase [Lachnospiraceae bacterium]|nr:aminopeptidase [Lachnospiraceae bacterium]